MQAPVIADVYLRPPRPMLIPLGRGRRLAFPGGHAEVTNGEDMSVVLQMADAVVDVRPGYDAWLPDWLAQCGIAPGATAEIRVGGVAYHAKPVRLKDEFGRFIARTSSPKPPPEPEPEKPAPKPEPAPEPPAEPEPPADPAPETPPATYPPSVFRGEEVAV